ncbi:hypothetical protein RGU72_21075 [Undibacterium sp. 5I1]|uniref:hypothetical protein n=1 Tax=Undibacterium sp. 5I1 TaxID=3048590 RepID=UPI002AB3E07A|nr:hypothetical protein [Undibacterium sp. 5I1]MDY7540741.1 hypothetical protein [Undibacterium sp. 5I1]MEB0259622.1 hypothetical protein [Undibacterium sp. 5I1]
MAQATTLKPGQIRHLLRVTNETSRHPELDHIMPYLEVQPDKLKEMFAEVI